MFFRKKQGTVKIRVLITWTGKIEVLELPWNATKYDATQILKSRGYPMHYPYGLDGWPISHRDNLPVRAYEVRHTLQLSEEKRSERDRYTVLYGCPIARELEQTELTRTVTVVDYT